MKDRWKNILSEFNEKTRRSYDKKQMKNRWDSLKKEWKVWDKLFSKETGIQYDSAKYMVIAEDEWWERKIQENADYTKYRYKGLMFAKELDILFKDVLALGSTQFTPSTGQRLAVDDDDTDVYRPTMDLQEGSGDSEEDLGPGGSVGVTGDMEGITLTINTQTTDGSGKRKRVEGLEKGRKKKTATSRVIADAVSKIAAATENRADALQKMSTNDALNVVDVVVDLLTIPEVVEDKDFCFRCSNMMMHQIGHDMFRGLQGDKTTLLTWLRHHTYNSPHLQLAPNQ